MCSPLMQVTQKITANIKFTNAHYDKNDTSNAKGIKTHTRLFLKETC